MNAIRARALLWVVLVLALAIVAVLEVRGRAGDIVQTDFMALLPATEKNPVAERAVSRLADITSNRAVFLVGGDDSTAAAAAARDFARELRVGAAFRTVTVDIPPFDAARSLQPFIEHRFQLLSAADRQALAADTPNLQERLARKLYAPMQFGLSLPVAQDPFGLTDDWIAELPLNALRLEPQDGVLVAREARRAWVLVSAELAGSAYDDRVQQAVRQGVARAEQVLARTARPAALLRTGAVFYAGAARDAGEREFHWISAGSLIGTLLLLYLVFRSPRPLVLGLLSVGFGVSAGLVATLAVHGQIHLITLVFGAALIGEAIDYCIQYFAAHMGSGPEWEPMNGLRRVAPGLGLALATSLLGYATLLLTPFPALSQIALFALVGLCAAWLSVFLLLPALLAHPSRRRPGPAIAAMRRWLLWWQSRVTPRLSLLLVLALTMTAAPGWLLLHSDDDIRVLVTRPEDLKNQEARIRELTGLGNSTQFFLIEGRTAEEVLQREERLAARLADLVAAGTIASWQGVSAFVPSEQRQADNHALWSKAVFSDARRLEVVLRDAGLREQVARAQIAAFRDAPATPLTVAQWLASPLSAPMRFLWQGPSAQSHASVVLPQGATEVRALERAAEGLEGVTLVDKAGSVSGLFRSYRKAGIGWMAATFALIYAVLCLRYGARQAAGVLVPTAVAVALTLGLFGYLDRSFTLFNLMGLMLVLGVGVNYAIFLREGGVSTASALAGVLLSAGTTVLSFGLLAFSSTPALAGFGLTLLAGVSLAMLLAPLALSIVPRSPA